MVDQDERGSTSHGLAFLALLAFVTSFLSARIFATLNPTVIVQSQGVHFHHFWYGLAMVSVVGWLGIAHNDPRYLRLYAVVFGLGGGLVGDEIGLLLTFGNYNSSLTFFFFVLVVALGSMAVLLGRHRHKLEYDVIRLGGGERILYAGSVVAGLSSLGFAAGLTLIGATTLVLGLAVAASGYYLRRRRRST